MLAWNTSRSRGWFSTAEHVVAENRCGTVSVSARPAGSGDAPSSGCRTRSSSTTAPCRRGSGRAGTAGSRRWRRAAIGPACLVCSSPQASTTRASQSAVERPCDAVVPDVRHLAHAGEIAAEDGRIGFHPNDALQVVAHRPRRRRRPRSGSPVHAQPCRAAAASASLIDCLPVDHRAWC